MGKIKFPKKIKFSSIIKLLMLSAFIFAGFYFYPNYNNVNQNSEVLQAVAPGPTPVYKIDNYIMKDVIRPTCDKTQPYMDFFCQVTTTSASKTVISNVRIPTFGVNNRAEFNNYLTTSTISSTADSTATSAALAASAASKASGVSSSVIYFYLLPEDPENDLGQYQVEHGYHCDYECYEN